MPEIRSRSGVMISGCTTSVRTTTASWGTDTEHRSDRQEGAVHRLLLAAKLHRRPGIVHPRQHPFRTGYLTMECRAARTGYPTGRRPSPTSSRSKATRPGSSERPPRRSGQAPAHAARLRRVLGNLVPPECREEPGDVLLSGGFRPRRIRPHTAYCTASRMARGGRRSRTTAH